MNDTESRLGVVYQVDGDYYYFDSGTDKIVSCDEQEAELAASILRADPEEKRKILENNPGFASFIEQEHLFQCPEHRGFLVPTENQYKTMVAESCEQIILELTQQCNLRCRYCIYNDNHDQFRSFSSLAMTEAVAFRALDIVLSHLKSDSFALTYYGGEPLLNQELIKSTISYVLKKRPDLKLHVSFTTNLTLMTSEFADYLHDVPADEVSVLCSLDGPRDMHDSYRVNTAGRGSFEAAIRGYRILMDHFYDPEKKRIVSVNTVLTPPYSKKRFDEVNRFFADQLKLPAEMEHRFTYMDPGQMEASDYGGEVISGEHEFEMIPLEEWSIAEAEKTGKDADVLEMLCKELWFISTRQREPDGGIIQNTVHMANCIPGQRRLYVSADGSFYTCEKVGQTPPIGNVHTGLQLERAYRIYYTDFDAYYQPKCDQCWARTLCSRCYDGLMKKDGPDKNSDGRCGDVRSTVLDLLKLYCRLDTKHHDLLERILKNHEYS